MKSGPKNITLYSKIIEQSIITTHNLLSEKDKRIYLAVEAIKLPHGGVTYLSGLVGCSRNTIKEGLKELKDPDKTPQYRIRKKGRGRILDDYKKNIFDIRYFFCH